MHGVARAESAVYQRLSGLSRAGRLRWLGAFFLCVAVLFLLVNREAYQGSFTDDDLGNMYNATSPLSMYLHTIAIPSISAGGSSRAAAYLYYYALVRLAGMHLWPYIAGIHAIHLLNVLLVWVLASTLGAELLGSCAAALFYVFHASAFGVYWSPMYVFDLLCATFVLLALLAYIRGHDLLCLVFFWLSLKSKETAILFPLVLAAYEVTLGQRRWKRLIAYFAVSGVLCGFALRDNAVRNDVYTFRFTVAALWTRSRTRRCTCRARQARCRTSSTRSPRHGPPMSIARRPGLPRRPPATA